MTEKEIKYRIQILLSTYDGLLGRVDKAVRLIRIYWDEDTYKIKAYFDRPTTEADLEPYQDLTGEILAHFPDTLKYFDEQVEYTTKPLSEIDNKGYKEAVFMRLGELDYGYG